MRNCFNVINRIAAPLRLVGSVAALSGAIATVSPAALAASVQYFYDPAGQLAAVLDPVNGTAIYTYDAAGNLLSIKRSALTAAAIAGFSPSSGAVGTVVTISGTGFGTTANTTVSFNGKAATPTAVTSTQITVPVPTGATTGTISVTVTGGTATSVASFTVGAPKPPTLAALPTTILNQGASLTLTGTNFDPNLANDKVFINGRYAGITAATATSLTLIVPSVTTGPVTVETLAGSVTSTTNLEVPPLPYLAANVESVVKGTLGSSSTSAVKTAGDIGIITFTGTVGQRMSMQVTASSFGNGNLLLTVYGPDGAQIGGSGELSAGSFVDAQPLSATGTYTIVTAPSSGITGSATIALLNAANLTGNLTVGGAAVSLTTTAAGQNMSLTFAGTANQRIALTATEASGLGIGCDGLSISSPNSLVSIYSSQFCSPGTAFSDVVTLPISGTYTVGLDPAGAAVGKASFQVATVPADATATLAVGGATQSLTTTAAGQNMVLTFSGTAGQRISLYEATVSGLGNSSDTLTITEPDGTTSLFSACACNGGAIFSDVLTLPSTGIYTVLYNPADTSTGTASFALNSVPADATATIAINNKPVSVTTTTAGQNMSLPFSGTAGQRITLSEATVSGLGNSSDTLTITEPDGTTQLFSACTCNGGPIFSDVLTLPTTGNYTIAYNPSSTSIGTASFTLNTVPADANATIVDNGKAVSLSTTVAGQNMVLTFAGTANQRISLSEQTVSGLGNANDTLTITEPDGQTQLYSVCTCGGGSIFTDVLILPTAGTYTVTYNPNSTSTGTASFTLYSVPANAAATLTANATTALTTTAPGQNMSLTFAGTAGKRVSLYIDEVSGLGDCGDKLTVTEPNGTTQLFNNSYCTTLFTGVLPSESPLAATVLTLPTTGTYTIALNPANQVFGKANFSLYDVPADVNKAITIGAAASTLTTTAPGQSIRATFTGTASNSATVSVGQSGVTPAGGCYYVSVLEPNGSTLLSQAESCSTGYSTGSLNLPSSGTYTVIVSAADTAVGSYTVQVASP